MSLVLAGEHGSVTVPDSTLCALVSRAAELVSGARIRRRRQVVVDVVDGRAHVTVELVARYGAVLPDLARAVQEEIRTALEAMCGVEVLAVDVTVEEVE